MKPLQQNEKLTSKIVEISNASSEFRKKLFGDLACDRCVHFTPRWSLHPWCEQFYETPGERNANQYDCPKLRHR